MSSDEIRATLPGTCTIACDVREDYELHAPVCWQEQLAARDQQIAALHATVRTLGSALGACMTDPHTPACRSVWLCEQHRDHQERAAAGDAARRRPLAQREWSADSFAGDCEDPE